MKESWSRQATTTWSPRQQRENIFLNTALSYSKGKDDPHKVLHISKKEAILAWVIVPPASLTCFEVCQSGRTRVTSRDVTARSPAPRFLPRLPRLRGWSLQISSLSFTGFRGLVMAVRDLFSLQAWHSFRGSDCFTVAWVRGLVHIAAAKNGMG